jgi:signal transduction histidine kinase
VLRRPVEPAALLRIAQIETGVRRSSFRMVDLSEVMRTVADAYGPDVEDSGRFLRTDIPETLTIAGDRELLAQLFANLIENALKHTPKDTSIVMRLSRANSHVRAEISDNGPGIPEDERSRVLRRFYRLEHSRTTPGNGLGLSLVAAVADLHGATIALSDCNPGLKVAISFQAAMI